MSIEEFEAKLSAAGYEIVTDAALIAAAAPVDWSAVESDVLDSQSVSLVDALAQQIQDRLPTSKDLTGSWGEIEAVDFDEPSDTEPGDHPNNDRDTSTSSWTHGMPPPLHGAAAEAPRRGPAKPDDEQPVAESMWPPSIGIGPSPGIAPTPDQLTDAVGYGLEIYDETIAPMLRDLTPDDLPLGPRIGVPPFPQNYSHLLGDPTVKPTIDKSPANANASQAEEGSNETSDSPWFPYLPSTLPSPEEVAHFLGERLNENAIEPAAKWWRGWRARKRALSRAAEKALQSDSDGPLIVRLADEARREVGPDNFWTWLVYGPWVDFRGRWETLQTAAAFYTYATTGKHGRTVEQEFEIYLDWSVDVDEHGLLGDPGREASLAKQLGHIVVDSAAKVSATPGMGWLGFQRLMEEYPEMVERARRRGEAYLKFAEDNPYLTAYGTIPYYLAARTARSIETVDQACSSVAHGHIYQCGMLIVPPTAELAIGGWGFLQTLRGAHWLYPKPYVPSSASELFSPDQAWASSILEDRDALGRRVSRPDRLSPQNRGWAAELKARYTERLRTAAQNSIHAEDRYLAGVLPDVEILRHDPPEIETRRTRRQRARRPRNRTARGSATRRLLSWIGTKTAVGLNRIVDAIPGARGALSKESKPKRRQQTAPKRVKEPLKAIRRAIGNWTRPLTSPVRRLFSRIDQAIRDRTPEAGPPNQIRRDRPQTTRPPRRRRPRRSTPDVTTGLTRDYGRTSLSNRVGVPFGGLSIKAARRGGARADRASPPGLPPTSRGFERDVPDYPDHLDGANHYRPKKHHIQPRRNDSSCQHRLRRSADRCGHRARPT